MLPDAYVAAYIALISLEVGIPASAGTNYVIMVSPETRPLTFDEAARRIAEMPKPLTCDGEWKTDHLVVICHPPEKAISNYIRSFGHSRCETLLASIHEILRESGQTSAFVKNDRRVLEVSPDAISDWCRDFTFITSNTGFSVSRKAVWDRPNILGAVIHFRYTPEPGTFTVEPGDDDDAIRQL